MRGTVRNISIPRRLVADLVHKADVAGAIVPDERGAGLYRVGAVAFDRGNSRALACEYPRPAKLAALTSTDSSPLIRMLPT